MNSAKLEATSSDGTTKTVREEQLPPLEGLWTPNGPHARVGFNAGRSIEYGNIKLSASVSYECDQNTATINRVGLLAFEKALEFLNDGWTAMTGQGSGT